MIAGEPVLADDAIDWAGEGALVGRPGRGLIDPQEGVVARRVRRGAAVVLDCELAPGVHPGGIAVGAVVAGAQQHLVVRGLGGASGKAGDSNRQQQRTEGDEDRPSTGLAGLR